MKLLIALGGSAVFAWIFRAPLKRYPEVFYLAAVVIDVALLSGALMAEPHALATAALPYLTRCLVGFALFTVVMYVGALPDGNKVRQGLMPVRGELSIVAAILTIGHVVNYLGAYFAQITSGFAGMTAGMVVSFGLSTILIVLLAMLTVTSFNFVKYRMAKSAWKCLQKTAYLFFSLTYAHLLFVLVPTIASTSQRAMLSIAIYSVVMTGWAVLKLVKTMKARMPSTEATVEYDFELSQADV